MPKNTLDPITGPSNSCHNRAQRHQTTKEIQTNRTLSFKTAETHKEHGNPLPRTPYTQTLEANNYSTPNRRSDQQTPHKTFRNSPAEPTSTYTDHTKTTYIAVIKPIHPIQTTIPQIGAKITPQINLLQNLHSNSTKTKLNQKRKSQHHNRPLR